MIINETREISLPNMSNTLCIITAPDKNGNRIRLNNVSARPDANIVRIFAPISEKKC